MGQFTKQQLLTVITFVVVNFCNAMCVSMQVSSASARETKLLVKQPGKQIQFVDPEMRTEYFEL